MITKMEINACKCNVCGYEWVPLKYQQKPEQLKECQNPRKRCKKWNGHPITDEKNELDIQIGDI